MFIRNLYADLLKLKGLPIVYAHIIIPFVTSGCFWHTMPFQAGA